MSFYGLNNPQKPTEIVDFQDSYEGYGEEESNDQFNDETFGADVSSIGQDFQFGASIDPAISYASAASKNVSPGVLGASGASASHNGNFNAGSGAATMPKVDTMKPLDSLWANNGGVAMAPQKKVLSVEELEAQMASGRGGMGAQQMPQMQQSMYHYGYAPQGWYMYPGAAGGAMQNVPRNFYGGPPGAAPGVPGAIPGAGAPQSYGYNAMPNMPQGMQQGMPQNMQQNMLHNMPQQMSHNMLHNMPPNMPQAMPKNMPSNMSQQAAPAIDSNQFPPLGAKSEQSEVAHQRSHQPRATSPKELDPQKQALRNYQQDRIYKYSLFMTPRDKDFVTRSQISRIVSDDPYSEDFYFQIYKAIRSKSAYEDDSLNSIAKYYLEHSGHKLGGQNQRADVALQRMQQQVSRALTVAKDRKGKQKTETGFGKVSIATNKTPRKQLEIYKKEIKENANSTEDGGAVSESSIKALQLNSSLILNSLEKVYSIVLTLESKEKNELEIDTAELWKHLYIEDKVRDSLFVSFLNYEKGIKLFPRVMRYLSSSEKLKVIENLMKKVTLLKLVESSSYDVYYSQTDEEKKKTEKKIDLFSNLFLKFLIGLDSSELGFNEIVKLIKILISSDSLLKLLQSKIGISLITILVSKIELELQDITITSSSLIIWGTVYDQMFNVFLNNLIKVFPKGLYVDDSVSWVTTDGVKSMFDDSYIWHFLASLALAGKIQHKKIIIDEVRDKIFECVEFAKTGGLAGFKEDSLRRIVNLNLFLNVMGLNASAEGEIGEL